MKNLLGAFTLATAAMIADAHPVDARSVTPADRFERFLEEEKRREEAFKVIKDVAQKVTLELELLFDWFASGR